MRDVCFMEFNEKLLELRKRKAITQEELAEALFVSRTAVSKWESGRGYPNIDSLKAIARFFGVTVDELLSGEELLDIAQADRAQRENRFRDILFGLLDCSVAMFFVLPFFGQRVGEAVQEVSLLALSITASWLRTAYIALVSLIVLCGVLTLAFQTCNRIGWRKIKTGTSLLLNAIAALLFVVSLQPYASVFLFVYLTIKVLMLVKWR